jgi:DNA-binding MarR family transcriptional regulator
MSAAEQRVSALAGELHRTLSRLAFLLRRGDASGGACGDITLQQLLVLQTLWESGPIRMTELAALERVRTPTAPVAIGRLERLGLVGRHRDAGDLRAVLVELTPLGMTTFRESLATRHAGLAAMLAELDDEDRETLRRALAPLVRLAGERPTRCTF